VSAGSSPTYDERTFAEAGFGWFHPSNATEPIVVFVHGWNDGPMSAWTARPWFASQLLPSILGGYFVQQLALLFDAWMISPLRSLCGCDPRPTLFKLAQCEEALKFDYLTFAHSGKFVDGLDIASLADQLRAFIRLNAPARRVILVAHSLGGLICRKAILQWLDQEGRKSCPVVGLFMFATPNTGTEVARIARLSASAARMKPYSEFLRELNKGWMSHVLNGGDPRKPADRRCEVFCRVAVGEVDKVVPHASAVGMSIDQDIDVLSKKDHSTVCKARNRDDPAFKSLQRFLTDCTSALQDQPVEVARAYASDHFRARFEAASGRWVLREKTTLSLKRPLAGSSLAGGGWLECHETCSRYGGFRRRSIRIGVRIEPSKFDVDVGPLDFEVVLGRGLMSSSELRGLVSDLATRRPNAILGVLEITSVSMTTSGESKCEFQSHSRKNGSDGGWCVVELKPPEDAVWIDGQKDEYVTLSIAASYPVNERQRWYQWCAATLILEDAAIALQSDVRLVRGRDSFAGTANPGTINESTVAERWDAEFSATGPIFPGAWVDFMFDVDVKKRKPRVT